MINNKYIYKNKKNNNKDRPIFYYNNDITKEIKAGGIIFYRVNRKNIEFFLIKTEWRKQYEDFGGKTDIKDKDIWETACREADEESNGIFKKKDLYKYIKNQIGLYTIKSKYIFFFYEIKDMNLHSKDFGNLEFCENVKRIVEIIQLNDILNKKINLHDRLIFPDFFNELFCLYQQIINGVNY